MAIDIPIRPGLAYLKPFYVSGRRRVSEAGTNLTARAFAALQDMESQAVAFFAVSPPVEKWRREPETQTEPDFVHGDLVIQFSARGFFDQLVAFEDAQCLVTELP